MSEQQQAIRLSARGLRYSVAADGATLRVLDSVDLDLRTGELATVSGPSGAGKSSLLWVLARMHAADTGELFLNGASAEGFSPCRWRTRVALLPQTPRLVDGTVQQNLALPWKLKVRTAAETPTRRAMHLGMHNVGLGDIDLSRDVSELSGGQAARVALLRTLLTGPDVLLLDESTAALDDDSASLVFDCIKDFANHGGAVLAVLHQRTPDMPHRVLHLENGSLTEEAPAH